MKKEDAKEVSIDIIESNGLFNLDSIVNYLIASRTRGENVYIDFPNGALGIVDRLYSCDIDFDKAYMLCFGMPYEVYRHLMAIQHKILEDLGDYKLVDSIVDLYSDLKNGYASKVEEIRKNNNPPTPKV